MMYGVDYGADMRMCFVDLPAGRKCVIVPKVVADYLENEDEDFWTTGDYSMLEILFPDEYDFIMRELGLKG